MKEQSALLGEWRVACSRYSHSKDHFGRFSAQDILNIGGTHPLLVEVARKFQISPEKAKRDIITELRVEY